MSVIYTCIAYKTTPLAHRGSTDKSEKQFAMDIEKVLENFVNKDNMRSSSQYNNMNFYVFLMNQVTYICFTDQTVSKQAGYLFLGDIAEAFAQKYTISMVKQAVKFQMDREFGAIIGQKMSNIKLYQNSQAQEIQKDLEEVKNLVMQNIDQVMKRATDLQDIESDAVALRDNAGEFLQNARNLKRQMQCKKIAIIGGIVAAAVVILLIIIIPIVT